jgi:tRNA pseudouridine38-40 synthase
VCLEQRFKAIVGYDGTDFLGYQLQAKGRTVQGEIEKSLKNVVQSSVRVDGAGRTDSGVHAVGQVIAFNAVWRHSITDLHRALNATLPDDIVISNLTIVDREFHPRFRATSRTYQYRVITQRWPSVLQRRYTYHLATELDLDSMNRAAQQLVGQKDFASFGKPPQGNNTVRNILMAEWLRDDSDEVRFNITANAFLYRMVRNIVGTLLQVGTSRISVEDVTKILSARDIRVGKPLAPAHGLCLMKVTYPGST